MRKNTLIEKIEDRDNNISKLSIVKHENLFNLNSSKLNAHKN
jgi:hypothetical protein